MAAQAEIGVIGGTGFYAMEGLTAVERLSVPTPFGDPSSQLTIGTLHGRRVAFLARTTRATASCRASCRRTPTSTR